MARPHYALLIGGCFFSGAKIFIMRLYPNLFEAAVAGLYPSFFSRQYHQADAVAHIQFFHDVVGITFHGART